MQHGKHTRLAAVGLAVVTATATTMGLAGLANAGNPPAGPGTIEVFPARDMVAIEGYAAQAGQDATITVKRGTQVIGTASGQVDSTGFLEINHEGSPQPDGTIAGCFDGFTPDIVGGDVVEVRFSNSPLVDGMVVASSVISEVVGSDPVEGPNNTVTISGTYGPDVDLGRFAVEVVNPDMRDFGAIGERAIHWEGAPVTAPGYSVDGTAADGQFSVTFSDLTPTDQALILDGDHIALSWMADGTAGEEIQLGLSLYETSGVNGGGPGCPPGVGFSDAPQGTYFAVRSTDGASATVSWSPAVPQPTAAPVTGYSVMAVQQGGEPGAPVRQTGFRTGSEATQVVIDGLDPAQAYGYEVRSLTDTRMSPAFPLASTTPTEPPPDGETDTVAPTLVTTPTGLNETTAVVAADRTLVLSANEGTIFYTTDGSSPTTTADSNIPSTTARIYTAPIPITAADTMVRIAVIDDAGNVSRASGLVSPVPAAAAVAPEGLTVLGTAGAGPDPAAPQGRVSLGWSPVPDATEYRVRVYVRTEATDTTPLTIVLQPDRDVLVTGTTADVTGLPKSGDGQRYIFRVQSKTSAGPAWSTLSTPVNHRVVGDDISVGLAQYRTGDEFRLDGAGTVPGARITFHRSNLAGTGPIVNPLPGFPTAIVGALEAPENVGAWDATIDAPLPPNPGTFWIKSSEGAVAGPFTVEVR